MTDEAAPGLVPPRPWLPGTPRTALVAASVRTVPMWRVYDTIPVQVSLKEALRVLADENPAGDEPGYRVICRPLDDRGRFEATLFFADEGPAVQGGTGRLFRGDVW